MRCGLDNNLFSWKTHRQYFLPEIIEFAVDFLVFDVAAAVLAQGRAAHRTLQAAQVPVQVIDLCARDSSN